MVFQLVQLEDPFYFDNNEYFPQNQLDMKGCDDTKWFKNTKPILVRSNSLIACNACSIEAKLLI